MGLTGFGDRKAIATFVHDVGGVDTLFAYPPEPAAETRQGELVADWLYGVSQRRSPKTPYMCAWRDPDPTRLRAGAEDGPPSEIFLFCIFGTSPWEPPAGMIEHAEQAMRRDHAEVRIGWKRRDGGYVMTRLEVCVGNLAQERDFRSIWFDDEIGSLPIRQSITFPGSPADPIAFSIAASLPRRFNRGEVATEPMVDFAIEGTAPPIPDWLLY